MICLCCSFPAYGCFYTKEQQWGENNRKYLVLSCSFVLFFRFILLRAHSMSYFFVDIYRFSLFVSQFSSLPHFSHYLFVSWTSVNGNKCNFLFYAYAYINVEMNVLLALKFYWRLCIEERATNKCEKMTTRKYLSFRTNVEKKQQQIKTIALNGFSSKRILNPKLQIMFKL